jgi:hypothetical protein
MYNMDSACSLPEQDWSACKDRKATNPNGTAEAIAKVNPFPGGRW